MAWIATQLRERSPEREGPLLAGDYWGFNDQGPLFILSETGKFITKVHSITKAPLLKGAIRLL